MEAQYEVQNGCSSDIIRDRVVSVVTRLRTGTQGSRVSIFAKDSICFSTPKCETGSGTGPLPYSPGTKGKAVGV